ncbi:DNA-binding protein [Phenylobacterium sp.]|uniref:DNA-binding protein n=1 Tax=Phenylobacterium sp. TaxID=1871053 RepID=UPI00286AA3A8|nr:DNA-binding protein [Phenylobacterium sp.]
MLAAAAGLTEPDLALVFKDQRVLSAGEVAGFAELLGVTVTEVAGRAGVSTPIPRHANSAEVRVTDLESRVARLEADVARLTGR